MTPIYPSEYETDCLKLGEHERICDERLSGQKKWMETVIFESKMDRENLWKKIELHDNYMIRMQWWAIGILATIIVSSMIVPKLSGNGLAAQVMAIDSKQARQERISAENNKALLMIMDKLKIQPKSGGYQNGELETPY